VVETETENNDEINQTTYHVHKNMLGVGPRRSAYFSRLFRTTQQLTELESSTSVVRLECSAAAAFPDMLDFVYSPVGNLDVSTENAVALRHLSLYFGIRSLFSRVNAFIQGDLNASTSTTYLTEATIYHDDKLINVACMLCAHYFANSSMVQLEALPPCLFRKVVKSSHLHCGSEVLSTRVSEYCRAHPEAVEDNGYLESLTNPKKMPHVHPKEALYLLSLWIQNRSCDGDNDNHDGEDQSESTHTPSLQQRCITASSKDWKNTLARSFSSDSTPLHHHDTSSTDGVTRKNEYINLPPHVKIELLESALYTASQDIDSALSANASLNVVIQSQRENIRSVKAERETSVKELIKAQNKLKMFQSEMKKFKRVPKEHRFDASDCVYSSTYGYGYNSRHAPSAMPRIDKNILEGDKDGYLFCDTKEAKYWPIYYYSGS